MGMVIVLLILGLFGISNYGFGGETRTKEPQEKIPKTEKRIHLYGDSMKYFPLRPVWNFKLWFWWRDKN